MNIKFDSDPVYGDSDKYIKTKIQTYGDKVNNNFQGKNVPKENASYMSLSLIKLYSVINVNETYYPQILLEERKNKITRNKVENLINDALDSSSLHNESDDLIVYAIMHYQTSIPVSLDIKHVNNIKNSKLFITKYRNVES